MQLQKEIYNREAKVLGLNSDRASPASQMASPELRPKFQAALDGQMFRSQDVSSAARSRIAPRQYNNSVSGGYGMGVPADGPHFSSKSLENIYKARIGAAIRYKDQYDFNNRSPITWLGKNDSVTDSYYIKGNRGNGDDSYKFASMLNTKKVFKGMGYNKTNIFYS